MGFPLEKYSYYIVGNKVIAVSTYAGKPVRGVAKCADEDTYSIETGKEIAAARCNAKVAAKRKKRAMKKYEDACAALAKAQRDFNSAVDYLKDSHELEKEANAELNKTLAKY